MIESQRVLKIDETITESEGSHSNSLADSSESESGDNFQKDAAE